MKEEVQLKVTNDYIFKRIFAKRGNESILKDLLNAILGIKIKKIEVMAEANLEKEIETRKLGILDIKAILNNDTIIDIEIQIINRHNMIERTLYYWSGLYYNQLQKGEEYQESKRVIAINILDYNEFMEGPYHEIAKLRREYMYRVLTNKMEIHFIQIPKFKKYRKDMKTKLDMWMEFISQIDKEGVENAMSKNKEIKKAQKEYEYLTGEENERRIAFLMDKALRDEKSAYVGGKQEGIKEGIKEGLKEGIKLGRKDGEQKKQEEIAKNMKKKNMKVELISEITGLTKKQIENL